MSAVLAAAACLAVAILPASAAERPVISASDEAPPVSIELIPGTGIWQNKQYNRWEARSYALFSVKFTDVGDKDLRELTTFVSVPYEVEITGYEGEGWECWDTDGGIDCHNTHVVVPREAWPALNVRFRVLEHMNVADSIDVYATTGDYGWAHAGVPFKTTTST